MLNNNSKFYNNRNRKGNTAQRLCVISQYCPKLSEVYMNSRIHIYELGVIFLLGAFIYSLIEIVFRGHTHWTMTLLGGVAGAVLYCISAGDEPLFLKAFAGAFIITALEMCVGVVDNIILKWSVWDYSDMPFNLFGQICLPFSALWFLLCFPALFFCRAVRNQFNKYSGDRWSAPTKS